MGAEEANVALGRNNPWLDLIRSLAILLVFSRHGQNALHTGVGDPLGVIGTIFMNGWAGVDLFFVLSGYLIARHLLRAGLGSGRFQLGRYIAMRALRIVPAYYAVLLLVVAGAFPLFPVAPEDLGFRVTYHLLFLQDYLPSNINVVFWSLGVEEKFYLLAPLLVFALVHCRNAQLRALVMILLFILPIALRTAIYLRLGSGMEYPAFWQIFRSPFHMALEALIVGVGIALAEHAGAVPRSRLSGGLILATGAAILAVWLGTHDFMADIGLTDALAQPPLIALLAGAMTLGAVQLAGTPMPLTPLFQGVSRVSYSLYLVHYPLTAMALAMSRDGGAAAFWSLYVTSSLAAALLLHLTIERPFLLIKDRIASRGAPLAANELPHLRGRIHGQS